ncbi:MAG TPA: CHAT domain-containing protein, partial [Candidatus Obscuribacterales bacterium]
SERGRARAFAELLGHRLALQGQTPPPASLAPPPIDQIRQIAQAQNATLVEYAIVGDSLYIWVVQPDGTLHFKEVAIPEQEIAAAVGTTRTALGVPVRGLGVESIDNGGQSRAIALADESLRQLHRLLIEPIAAFLPPDPTATVVIIPQGELFLVPFPALLDAQNIALVDHHPLLFAPAISLLTPTPPTADVLTVRPEEALIVGNPVMPPDPDTGVPLPPLYGSEIEALEIATLLETEPLIGASATKATVVATMPKAKIIHLATHGLLDDFGTGVPGILALTPTTDDGGFLTATEILALPLQAQLAVLSACNTGQGKITGDGVVGLSRSLLTAGVDNVMVTLWAIPDVTTAELMAAFYTELAQTPNRAIALQKAMLTTRATYDDPLNWAAFSLYGRSANNSGGALSVTPRELASQ